MHNRKYRALYSNITVKDLDVNRSVAMKVLCVIFCMMGYLVTSSEIKQSHFFTNKFESYHVYWPRSRGRVMKDNGCESKEYC